MKDSKSHIWGILRLLGIFVDKTSFEAARCRVVVLIQGFACEAWRPRRSVSELWNSWETPSCVSIISRWVMMSIMLPVERYQHRQYLSTFFAPCEETQRQATWARQVWFGSDSTRWTFVLRLKDLILLQNDIERRSSFSFFAEFLLLCWFWEVGDQPRRPRVAATTTIPAPNRFAVHLLELSLRKKLS